MARFQIRRTYSVVGRETRFVIGNFIIKVSRRHNFHIDERPYYIEVCSTKLSIKDFSARGVNRRQAFINLRREYLRTTNPEAYKIINKMAPESKTPFQDMVNQMYDSSRFETEFIEALHDRDSLLSKVNKE